MVTRTPIDPVLTAYQETPTAENSKLVIEAALKWVSHDCDTAVDIGCGQNWIADMINCDTIGVDPGGVSVPYVPSHWPQDRPHTLLPTRADVIATLGDDWFQSRHAQFDCAFALASIHYRPLDQILEAMDQVMQMCTKRAYISINSRRPIDQAYKHFTKTGERTEIESNKKFMDSLDCDTHNLQKPYMEYLITHIPYTVEASWLFTHDGKDAGFEGDIHMVLSH